MAAPHSSDNEFHHPEPFGSTLDVGFGPQNIGVGFGLRIWPPRDDGFGCPTSPRALGLVAPNAVGRWQMLALAIRTLTLALDDGFGHPTSLRPSLYVEFCHPEPLESTLVSGSGHQNIAVILRQLSLVSPHPPWRHQGHEFGLPEPFGSTLDVGFGRGDVG